jgi:hypothetical protein
MIDILMQMPYNIINKKVIILNKEGVTEMAGKVTKIVNPQYRELTEAQVATELPVKIRQIRTIDTQIAKTVPGSTLWKQLVTSRNNTARLANKYIRFLRTQERNRIRSRQADEMLFAIMCEIGNREVSEMLPVLDALFAELATAIANEK